MSNRCVSEEVVVDFRRSIFGYNCENVKELSSDGVSSDGERAIYSGTVLIWVWLDDGGAEFFGSVGIEVFLSVFVAVGILCGQGGISWRTKLGSGIWRVRVVGIGWRRGLFKLLEVSCTVLWAVSDSSQESLLGEVFPEMVNFVKWLVVELLCICGWVVITDWFEVLVFHRVSLLLYQENMVQMGYGFRIWNPVCLYLILNLRDIQVVFGMNGLN